MVLNKYGQVIFFKLMLGIVVILLALAVAYPVKQSSDIARNSDNMDCDNKYRHVLNWLNTLDGDKTNKARAEIIKTIEEFQSEVKNGQEESEVA